LPSGQTYIDFLEGLLWLLVFQNFGLLKHQSHPKSSSLNLAMDQIQHPKTAFLGWPYGTRSYSFVFLMSTRL
jgi:hypothetical protein